MQTVGIVGVGWLGLEIAKKLVESGLKVKGTSRSEDKRELCNKLGLEFSQLDLFLSDTEQKDSFFDDCQIGIITVPPPKNSFQSYQHIILKAASLFPLNCHIIFTSSTGVYSAQVRDAKENSSVLTDYNFTSQLFLAEKMLLQSFHSRLTVLRLGGLIDERRNPARSLAGKTDLSNPDSPINLVHKDDVVEIIYQFLKQNKVGGVFNICCDNHSSRREFYTEQCKKLNITPPMFSGETSIWKKVNNEKIKKQLAFQFKHNF